MPSFTRQPTSNVTPDPGQGGNAVTGNTNTGHGSTNVARNGVGSESATCKWTTFLSVPGLITAITIKVDWSQDGSLSGVSPDNRFRIQYSVNGGGAWTSLRNVTSITSPSSGTSSASLTLPQDISQIQVRDLLEASGADPGDIASITASVSNIRLEVTTQEAQVIVMM